VESDLKFQDQPLWRQQYVPGQRGLDDAPLVRVEQDLQATPSTETYAILRDEMGTPVAVVDEAPGRGSGGGLRLLVRYLSAPYGQRHSELGPELVRIAYDPSITEVGTSRQKPTANQTVAGALRIVTTSPLASASLASGLVLEQWDAAAGSWQTAPRTDFAIGTADDDPTDLRVMRLAGWAKATRYRITLLPSITDTFGRGLILPEGERQGVVVELAVPEDGTTPPSYARSFALAYDKDASDTLAGAFPGGQTFGFQGAWTDPATGLAYHRARWYDAANATWLSEDPLQDLDSPNFYQPFLNNPASNSDPLGLRVRLMDDKALKLIVLGLPPELRDAVGLDANGFVDLARLNNANTTDANFLALKELAAFPETIEVSTGKQLTYIDAKSGKVNVGLFYFVSAEKEMEELVKMLGPEEARKQLPNPVPRLYLGEPLSPRKFYHTYDKPLKYSVSGNLAVVVADLTSAPEEELVGTMAHELYGHGVLYIRNQEWEHKELGGPVDKFIATIEARTRRTYTKVNDLRQSLRRRTRTRVTRGIQ